MDPTLQAAAPDSIWIFLGQIAGESGMSPGG